MTPDVNVLVAAFRQEHPHHLPASRWLAQAREGCESGRQTLRLLPMVVTGFLRLVTHPKVFVHPDPIEEAVDFVQALLRSPGVELLPAGGEWPQLREKVRAGALAGNQIPDAWIAACVEYADEHLVTFDRDFSRLLHAKAYTLLT